MRPETSEHSLGFDRRWSAGSPTYFVHISIVAWAPPRPYMLDLVPMNLLVELAGVPLAYARALPGMFRVAATVCWCRGQKIRLVFKPFGLSKVSWWTLYSKRPVRDDANGSVVDLGVDGKVKVSDSSPVLVASGLSGRGGKAVALTNLSTQRIRRPTTARST